MEPEASGPGWTAIVAFGVAALIGAVWLVRGDTGPMATLWYDSAVVLGALAAIGLALCVPICSWARRRAQPPASEPPDPREG